MTEESIEIKKATLRATIRIDEDGVPMFIPIQVEFTDPSEVKDKVYNAIMDGYMKRIRND